MAEEEKLSIEDLMQVQGALDGIESMKDFSVEVIHSVAMLQYETERYTKPFYKARSVKFTGKKIEDLPEDKELDPIKYTKVGLESGARIVLLTKDYLEIVEELDKEAAKPTEFTTNVRFKLKDFEKDDYVETEKGKKEKVKKSLITAAQLKHLQRFIE